MAKPWINSVMGLVAGLAIASSGISTAATSVTTYYACLKSGALSLVGTKAPTCPKGATSISWNSTGPAGVQGPAGSIGPRGLAGDRGLQGPQGIQGDVGPQGPKGIDGLSAAPYVVANDGTTYQVLTTFAGLPRLVTRNNQKFTIVNNAILSGERKVEVLDSNGYFSQQITRADWASFKLPNCHGPRLVYAYTAGWDWSAGSEFPASVPPGLKYEITHYRIGDLWSLDGVIYEFQGLTSWHDSQSQISSSPSAYDINVPGLWNDIPRSASPECGPFPNALEAWTTLANLRNNNPDEAARQIDNLKMTWDYDTAHPSMAMVGKPTSDLIIDDLTIRY